MNILGLSCFYHDAAACLMSDGEIVAAAQQERFSRKKHDQEFPTEAIAYCMKEGGVTIDDIDYVAFYDKPFTKFLRIIENYLAVAPRGYFSFIKAFPVWAKRKFWIKDLIAKELKYDGDIIFPEHHESHAASCFFLSPFEKAAIITADGVGEWDTSTYGWGEGNEIHLTNEIKYPHSLGLLYTAFTYFLGFKVNSGEYKVMGAAPYGTPKDCDLIKEKLIDIKEDGSFKLNLKYFGFPYKLRMINRNFLKLFGRKPRVPETWLSQDDFDIAASIQMVNEEIMLKIANHVYEDYGLDNLCLAGGVALNCVANGRILREGPFENIWIQPAAGDAGGAVGAAAFVYYSYLGNTKRTPMRDAYLGPAFTNDQIRKYLDQIKAPYHFIADDELVKKTAELIADENVVGWFQGRMEFGPRALGNRSILADARDEKMRDTLNLKIKFREGFRPFAPTVLEEKASEYFDIDCPSPYMLLVAEVRPDKRIIPAVTHKDFSARLQTVNEHQNPRFYRLIKEYEKITGVPVIINTSFNIRGEPIVCTPQEAYRCFMYTKMDCLVLGNYLLLKEEQPEYTGDMKWLEKIELD